MTTKVGIVPSVPGLVNRVLLPIARGVAARVAGIQKLSARRGAALAGVSKGNFRAEDVAASLETSLRELAIDRVDPLLLHDVASEQLADDALLRCLEGALGSGKTRALGMATHFEETLAILRIRNALSIPLEVIQIASHVASPKRRWLFADEASAAWEAGVEGRATERIRGHEGLRTSSRGAPVSASTVEVEVGAPPARRRSRDDSGPA